MVRGLGIDRKVLDVVIRGVVGMRVSRKLVV